MKQVQFTESACLLRDGDQIIIRTDQLEVPQTLQFPVGLSAVVISGKAVGSFSYQYVVRIAESDYKTIKFDLRDRIPLINTGKRNRLWSKAENFEVGDYIDPDSTITAIEIAGGNVVIEWRDTSNGRVEKSVHKIGTEISWFPHNNT